MPRSWLVLVCACAAGIAAGAVPRLPVRAVVDLTPADDPFPIRRLRGTDARLPELLNELEPGPVVRLPRAEFESRARAAGRAEAQRKNGPRVVDATYTAELDGVDLVGTAELGVLNASGARAFLPLDPLRLAVRDATWVSGGEAILAVPPGATAPAVWVERDGRSVLKFHWSLTGTTEPGERRFELRVPPSPVAELKLDLPAGQVPTAFADVLLTGPFGVDGKPARREWRLRFGGRAKVEFAVRAGGAPSAGATAALVAKYELVPGQLAAAFEYDLRPARGSVAEWTFTADPGLRVTEVIANNRAAWSVDPPLTPDGPRRVRVSLRQPGPGGKVLINAVAPLPADAPLPVVRPLGAVIESEAVELRVAPGLKIESWSPGDYRLIEATGAADQTRTLTLAGTLLPAGADIEFRRMPSVRTVAPEAEFATLERLDWRPGVSHSALVARVRVRVARGPLFQLVVRPPPGFTLDRAAPGAEELVSHVGAPVPAGQTIELARPLLAGQQIELRLAFRGPGLKPGAAVPFPAFAVVGATERDGWLSVSTDPAWAVKIAPGAGATPAGLWGWLTTDSPRDARAVYTFRAKEPDGFATFTPARPAVTAQAVVTLDAVGERWAAVTRFDITATGGVLPTVAVFVPGTHDDTRSWKLPDPTNAIADATPVPAELLDALPLFTPLDFRASAGTFWVLRLARPLTGTAALETTALGPRFGDNAVSLPVPRLLGADQTTRADVSPSLKGRAAAHLRGDVLRIDPIARGLSGHRFRIWDAYLLTAVRAPGDALVAFGGTVRDASGGTLPVTLPPGIEVRGVCVAGQWLNPAACAARDSDDTLRVPIPAGETRFEIRYRLPVATGWPAARVVSPLPGVLPEVPVRRWWTFAPGVLPGWPARPWDTTADDPLLLGGPLAGAPALVIQSDDEWVRVGSARTADAAAVGLVAALAAWGLLARRRGARGALGLAAVVVVAVAAAQLGPPWWARAVWPALVAAVVALGWVLAGIRLRPRSAVPVVASVLVACFALHAFEAHAGSGNAPTVLVVPGADGKEEVFAPRALLNRLDALARPPLPAPVVASAAYDVRADDGGARVTARLVVHAFRSGDNAVSLTLPDARLERVTVDGAAAFPAARPDGCTVAVGGPGRHEVEVRFAATVTASGADREVRFGVPDVADAKLSASLPGVARQPQAAGRIGRQVVGTAGDSATLEADLGALAPTPASAGKVVQLRWREGAGGAAVVKVREVCLWDVTEAGAELTAAYLVRVDQGAVAGLRFDVPAELEVLRVTVRTTEPTAAPLALQDWRLADAKGAFRALRVDFQGPATGRFLVVLECAPQKPLGRQPVLRFPKVVFGTVKGETEAVYGLRAARVAVDEVGRAGVIDYAPNALREFDAIPELKLDPAARVWTFRPVSGATAEVRPALRATEPPAARTLTAWRVGPHRADATGTVSWTARDSLAFVEFTIANVKVSEVRGADVAGWSQAGARVQVWLRAGSPAGAIEWSGTAVPAPPGKPPDPVPFDPAQPKVAHMRLAADEVRVRPIDGWAVRVDRARGWQGVPATGGELRFRTDSPAAQSLRVQLAPAR